MAFSLPSHVWLIAFGLSAVLTPNCLGQTQPSARPAACAHSDVTEQDVEKEIFSHYGNWQRPVTNVSSAVNVNITLALSSINDVIEKSRIFRISGYISVRWWDRLRVWNTTFPLNCVTYVVVPASTVWLPDIASMNSEGRYTLMQLAGEKVRIHSDGYAIFSPGGTFNVFCDMDFTYFPFDDQKCAVKFESWRYTHNFVTFNFGAPNVKIYQWSENMQWSLMNTSQALFGLSYFDPENTFDRVEFYIHIKRKSSYYLNSIIVPCAIILLAQVAIFALPVDEVQKLFILFTCLLSYLVFELMVVGEMPRSSDHIPLLTKYLDISMSLITVSIVGESVVFCFLRRSNTIHPAGPGFVHPLVEQFTVVIAKALLLSLPYPVKNAPDVEEGVDDNIKSALALDGFSPSANGTTVESDGVIALQKLHRQYASKSASERRRISNISGIVSAASPPATTLSSKMKKRYIAIARLQWRYLASVTDRVTLVIYLLCNAIIPITLFVIYPKLQEDDAET